MAVVEYSNGLLQNHHGTLDAVLFKTENAAIITDSSYQNNDAIECTNPNVPIIEIELPVGALSGTYDIKFVGENTAESSVLRAYLDVYKDGSLVSWTTGNQTNGEIYIHTPTPTVRLSFDPTSEYKLVLRSGATTDTSNSLVLDYIRLIQLQDDYDPNNNLSLWHKTIQGTNSTIAPSVTFTLDLDPILSYVYGVFVTVLNYDPTVIKPKIDSVGDSISYTFTAATGNLPEFIYFILLEADIELPYIKNNNAVD